MEAHREIEGDLGVHFVDIRVKTGFLAGLGLVCQSRGRDSRHQTGQQANDQGLESHCARGAGRGG